MSPDQERTWTSEPVNRLLAEHRAGLTHRAVCDYLSLDSKQATNALGKLKKGGLAYFKHNRWFSTRLGREIAKNKEKIRGGAVGKPRRTAIYKGSLRSRAWDVMRVERKSTIKDLLPLICSGSEGNPNQNINQYFNVLERAGYIKRLPRKEPGYAKTSNGFSVFILIKDTGPKAPVWRCKKGHLHDPNTNKTIDLTTGQEVVEEQGKLREVRRVA